VTTTVVAPSTTAPSEFQVVNPNDPTGTEDVLDVLFPDELPATGGQVAGMTLLAGLVLLLGVGATTVSSHRRQRRNGGR
jgi:LPXTG-motif cell wall-anchored protein